MQKIVPEKAILIPAEATCVFKGQIFDVYQWPQQLFDGSTTTFELLRRPDTVIVLCVKDDKIVFINEQQPNRSAYTRLPGGRVDKGETWDDAIKRECEEELGLQFANWKLVNVRQPVAKIEWFVALYIATNCTAEQPPKLDAGEKISLVPMTFEEAKKYVATTMDPLNEYTRQLFENADALDEILSLPEFKGKQIEAHETDE